MYQSRDRQAVPGQGAETRLEAPAMAPVLFSLAACLCLAAPRPGDGEQHSGSELPQALVIRLQAY